MMKKLFLSFVAVLMVSMTANAITINKALLQHNGEVTLFDGNNIQDAVNAAADGDTIYLTLGTFKPFTINKKITIRGTGETSIIDGNVSVNIPDQQTLTSTLLETLAVSGNVTVSSAVNDMILRKCKIANMSFAANVDGAVIDRCYITNELTLSSYIMGMTVVNTKLSAVKANSGATNNTTFVNCNVYRLYTNNFAGTIINSIIQNLNSYTIGSTVLLNTLISAGINVGSSSVTQHCYYEQNYYRLSDNCECNINLQSNGYLGTDGTIVGIYGGDTPFTLEPSVPKVTSSDLDLDNENKVLNVTLTVSPQ